MAIDINSLGAWTETNDTLTEDLHSALELLAHAPWSADPASPYVCGEREQQRILAAMRLHAVAGLKQIDAEIAAGTLIAEINALSAQARHEADLIKNAAKTIQGITKAVDLVTGVVGKFNALPFL